VDKVVLIGAGGHCKAAIDVIELDGTYSIAGVIEKNSGVSGPVLGYPILGSDNELSHLAREHPLFLVTIGQIDDPMPRINLFGLACDSGMKPISIVSPQAYISRHAQIHAGTIVMHGAIVNAHAQVGQNCIVNSLALIEHDSVIGNHCHISTGARVNGNVRVGDASFVGSGAVLKHGITIGARSVIGAGAYVDSDVSEGGVVKALRKL